MQSWVRTFPLKKFPAQTGAMLRDRDIAAKDIRRRLAASVLSAVISCAVFVTRSHAQEKACVPASAQAVASKSPIVLRKTSGFPCVIKRVNRGVELKANAAGEPEHIQNVILGSNGRYGETCLGYHSRRIKPSMPPESQTFMSSIWTLAVCCTCRHASRPQHTQRQRSQTKKSRALPSTWLATATLR